MIKRLFIARLLLFVVFSVATADSLVRDSRFITGRLEDGLTYYIRSNSVPKGKIHFRLVINAGSTSESDAVNRKDEPYTFGNTWILPAFDICFNSFFLYMSLSNISVLSF